MKTITPHLWFNTQAVEPANFYTSVFPNSKITNVTTLHNTPSGDCDTVAFEISNQSFMAISAGPLFKLNPSISFFVNFDPSRDDQAKENLTALWTKLSEGGTELMPLQEYPFSKWYGWIQDKYGVTWQLMLTNPGGEERPFIIPSLMFVGPAYGKAEEATDYYLSVFKNTKRGIISRYGKALPAEHGNDVMFTDFMINNQWFAAMDGAGEHAFTFNEAISLMVPCETQEEIDYYWQKLSAVPEAEQCGWCKDKYGVSWQVTSSRMQIMMSQGTPEQIDRVTQAFLPMKKFDIAKLEDAYQQK
jgi:predicted 3-demethylubiquinone-9 3-methyltransferase (glyoxalase superfamily)